MMIYAILAVEYFSSFGMSTACDGAAEDASHCYTTTLRIGYPPDAVFVTDNVTSISPRNLPYGQEYYGTFSRALYTLFQVLTGESWSEAVARPLIFGEDKDSVPPWVAALFFASFILLTQIVLVNVVVAVLLDQFVTDDGDKEGGLTETDVNKRLAELLAKVEEQKESLDFQKQELAEHMARIQDALTGGKRPPPPAPKDPGAGAVVPPADLQTPPKSESGTPTAKLTA